MATITTRSGKGSPLTNNEVDANFNNLNTDKAELSGAAFTGAITTNSTIDGRDVATDGTKLDGIESGATADQTAAQIKTAYESNSDTNAFTDADESKLDGIEASADVTDTTNVTAAGALMDSELTSIASVKALNQGVATTDSPTFVDVTATSLDISGNIDVDGTTNLDVVDIDGAVDMASTLAVGTRVGIGVAAHTSAALNITTTDQHIRFNNGSELGIIELDSDGELNIWAHGDGEVINLKTGSGTGNNILSIAGSASTFSGAVTANAGVVVDNITIDGNEIDVSSGNLTLDVAGDIILDADGDNWLFKKGGTTLLNIQKDANNVEFISSILDGDIKFRGVDGGSIITALTLDMSNAGAATFNSTVNGMTIKASASGDRFGCIPEIASNGVMEVGRYIDFHATDGDTSDYGARLDFDGTSLIIAANTVTTGAATFNAGATFGAAINAGGTITGDDGLIIDGGAGNAYLSVGSNTGSWAWKNYQATHKLALEDSDGTGEVLNFSTTGAATFNSTIAATGSGNAVSASHTPAVLGSGSYGGGIATRDGAESGWYQQTSGADWHFYHNRTVASQTPESKKVLSFNSTGTATFNAGVLATSLDITSTTPKVTFVESDVSKQYEIGSFGGAFAIRDSTASQYRYILDTNGNHIFNEGSQDCDFRVESNNNANMLFVDGGLNRVGIGTASVPANRTLQVSSGVLVPIEATSSAGETILSIDNTATNGRNYFLISGGTAGTYAGGKFGIFDADAAADRMSIDSSGNVTFNEGSLDSDFRVESDAYSSCLHVNAGDNSVNFHKAATSVSTSGFTIGIPASGVTSSMPSGNTYHVYRSDGVDNGYKFYVNFGGQILSTSTSISGLSDVRLKENIVDLETGLSEVMALKPRRFDWKGNGNKNVAGFIAQEVETILPELIGDFLHDDLADAKSVKMGDMVPTLVKAIQEQQTLIETLTARITALENA